MATLVLRHDRKTRSCEPLPHSATGITLFGGGYVALSDFYLLFLGGYRQFDAKAGAAFGAVPDRDFSVVITDNSMGDSQS